MSKQMQGAIGSYLRAAVSAVLGAWVAGQTDPKLLITLAISAIAAPLLRAINPKDQAYGVKQK